MAQSKATIWQDTVNLKQKYPQLKSNLTVDALVIGGGITGITTAYLLSRLKLKTALIEKSTIGLESATAFTTAMIMEETDMELSTLIDTFGKRNAKLAWQAGREAIDFIDKTVKKEKIDCDFSRVSAYVYGMDEKEFNEINEEANVINHLGFRAGIERKDLGFGNYGYFELKNQAKFNPLKYVKKLADIASKNEVKIFEDTKALEIYENGDGIAVTTEMADIAAKSVVMATYSPFNHPLSLYFKAGNYVTYMILAKIKKGLLPEALYVDNNNPYHYFRVDSEKHFDTILIGGEDHRQDLPVSGKKNFAALEKYLKKIVNDYEILKHWTGPILESIDGLPYAGRFKKNSNIYITHGFSGTGMTFGTTSALLFRDLITGKKNKFEKLLDPQRLPTLKQLMAKGRDYSEEFIGGAIKNTFT